MPSGYEKCMLCQRTCGADRTRGERGFCAADDVMRVSRVSVHMWEEPVISGECGSGTVFFSGCSLGCIFCQNCEISRVADNGVPYTPLELAEAIIRLMGQGVHNINFVTPTHYAPSVVRSVEIAKNLGLTLPIVYNTASYESVSTVRSLRECVDIFLPDYKYARTKTASDYSRAPDYPETALAAISEMVKIRPEPIIKNGIMERGVIVRILLLPSHVAEAKLALSRLYERFGQRVYFSLMSQYTPMPNMKAPLDRRVTLEEYSQLVAYAEKIGITQAFVQERDSADTAYIPDFNK